MNSDFAGGDVAGQEWTKPKVHGIKSGLALVAEPQNAVAFATLRTITFDGQGHPTISVIDLTYDEACQLQRGLESLTGDSR